MGATPVSSDYLTTAEVARLRGVTRQAIQKMARSGKLPFQMCPYGRLYKLDDVRQLSSRIERRNGAAK